MPLSPITQATVVIFSELGFAAPIKEHHLLIVFLSVVFGFTLKQNGSGKKQ